MPVLDCSADLFIRKYGIFWLMKCKAEWVVQKQRQPALQQKTTIVGQPTNIYKQKRNYKFNIQ
jgi:hypothetical protein